MKTRQLPTERTQQIFSLCWLTSILLVFAAAGIQYLTKLQLLTLTPVQFAVLGLIVVDIMFVTSMYLLDVVIHKTDGLFSYTDFQAENEAHVPPEGTLNAMLTTSLALIVGFLIYKFQALSPPHLDCYDTSLIYILACIGLLQIAAVISAMTMFDALVNRLQTWDKRNLYKIKVFAWTGYVIGLHSFIVVFGVGAALINPCLGFAYFLIYGLVANRTYYYLDNLVYQKAKSREQFEMFAQLVDTEYQRRNLAKSPPSESDKYKEICEEALENQQHKECGTYLILNKKIVIGGVRILCPPEPSAISSLPVFAEAHTEVTEKAKVDLFWEELREQSPATLKKSKEEPKPVIAEISRLVQAFKHRTPQRIKRLLQAVYEDVVNNSDVNVLVCRAKGSRIKLFEGYGFSTSGLRFDYPEEGKGAWKVLYADLRNIGVKQKIQRKLGVRKLKP